MPVRSQKNGLRQGIFTYRIAGKVKVGRAVTFGGIADADHAEGLKLWRDRPGHPTGCGGGLTKHHENVHRFAVPATQNGAQIEGG